MKTKTLENRLAKLNYSKSSKAYFFVKEVINEKKEIRPCFTSGSGRFCKNMDYTADTCRLLDLLKIKYVISNDAPRGGLTGNLITIKTKIS